MIVSDPLFADLHRSWHAGLADIGELPLIHISSGATRWEVLKLLAKKYPDKHVEWLRPIKDAP